MSMKITVINQKKNRRSKMMKIVTNNKFGSKIWNSSFFKEESLTRVINEINIGDYEFIRIEKTYTINDDRLGAIVHVKIDDRLNRIVIDFKQGKPLRSFSKLTFKVFFLLYIGWLF